MAGASLVNFDSKKIGITNKMRMLDGVDLSAV